MPIKFATEKEVLRRMANNDMPCIRGGYSDGSAFEDGTLVKSKTMHSLFMKGKVYRPEGTSIHCPWTLRPSDKWEDRNIPNA